MGDVGWENVILCTFKYFAFPPLFNKSREELSFKVEELIFVYG